jgi:hypothetical protein
MIETIRRLVRSAFPGFPEHHVPRLGEVVAIADPIPEEQGTDRFRPRYAVDVQPLTPAGATDPDAPTLRALPLPVIAAGQGRGIYGFPEIGARVLYAFAYGLASHPCILAVYPQGQALPALAPGDLLIQQGEGAHLRFDARGNLTLQTDGRLTVDSHTREVAADDTIETHGSLAQTVDGDLAQTIGGRLLRTVLGALVQQIGGDLRSAVLGSAERTVAGEVNELAGGKYEQAALDYKLTVVPGVGKVSLGNGAVELLALLDAVLTALQAETHGTGVGPSTTPLNVADYVAQQLQLTTLKR